MLRHPLRPNETHKKIPSAEGIAILVPNRIFRGLSEPPVQAHINPAVAYINPAIEIRNDMLTRNRVLC